MKKIFVSIIYTFITMIAYSQDLSKEFLLKNFFETVERINDNHFRINLKQNEIIFDLIEDDFNIISFVNPNETKESIKPINSTSSILAKKTPDILKQVYRIDSLYIHNLLTEEVRKFNDYYLKNKDIKYYTLTKQNEIIQSLNYTKVKLKKSANLQIAGIVTSLVGGVLGTSLILSPDANQNIGYGITGGSIMLGGLLNLASIGPKRKASKKLVKPIEF